jgi:hypothetical protein
MTSSQVAAKSVEEVLVVSECCFGAQLFDPKNAGGAVPICVSYMAGGCLGFLGSTNMAFGGIGEWVGADLLATFFFQKALGGASLGRALAEARQDFIKSPKSQQMISLGNLKTLAQFTLYGDPSVTPCEPQEAFAPPRQLDKEGQTIAQAAWIPTETGSVSADMIEKVRAVARDKGYKNPRETIEKCTRWDSVHTGSPDGMTFMITISSEPEALPIKGKSVMHNRYMVAYIVNDEIIKIEEAASR